MIGGDPVAYLHTKLGRWGGQGLGHIEPAAMAEYERCFCTPEGIHGACEDYRASAGIDLELDRASRADGQRVACDMLVLWGERGVVNRLFRPLELWQSCCAGASRAHDARRTLHPGRASGGHRHGLAAVFLAMTRLPRASCRSKDHWRH
jgi:hypothetical protein